MAFGSDEDVPHNQRWESSNVKRDMPRRELIYLAVAAISLLAGCIGRYTGESVNKPVRENGVSASARVLEIWDTGVKLNDNPVVGFRLEVTLEDGTTYEATTKNVVSIVHIPQVQPGAVLPVKVDREDRSLVALDIFE